MNILRLFLKTALLFYFFQPVSDSNNFVVFPFKFAIRCLAGTHPKTLFIVFITLWSNTDDMRLSKSETINIFIIPLQHGHMNLYLKINGEI